MQMQNTGLATATAVNANAEYRSGNSHSCECECRIHAAMKASFKFAHWVQEERKANKAHQLPPHDQVCQKLHLQLQLDVLYRSGMPESQMPEHLCLHCTLIQQKPHMTDILLHAS